MATSLICSETSKGSHGSLVYTRALSGLEFEMVRQCLWQGLDTLVLPLCTGPASRGPALRRCLGPPPPAPQQGSSLCSAPQEPGLTGAVGRALPSPLPFLLGLSSADLPPVLPSRGRRWRGSSRTPGTSEAFSRHTPQYAAGRTASLWTRPGLPRDGCRWAKATQRVSRAMASELRCQSQGLSCIARNDHPLFLTCLLIR